MKAASITQTHRNALHTDTPRHLNTDTNGRFYGQGRCNVRSGVSLGRAERVKKTAGETKKTQVEGENKRGG